MTSVTPEDTGHTSACCCSRTPASPSLGRLGDPWADDVVRAPVGDVPRVKTTLDAKDSLGALKVRCGFGRTSYLVPPGLYAVGAPSAESLVFVSANYKLSFDRLRSSL